MTSDPPMQRLHYSEQSFRTDARIAAALLDYARVLATVGQADVVDVPGLDEEGVLRRFAMVVGPASQMIAQGVDDAAVEMAAEEAVREIETRRDRRLPRPGDGLFVGLPADDPRATAPEAEGSPSADHG